MNAHDDIRIGTLVAAHDRTPEVIRQLCPHGFETVQNSFGKSVGDASLSGLSDPVLWVLDACPIASGDPRPRAGSFAAMNPGAIWVCP